MGKLIASFGDYDIYKESIYDSEQKRFNYYVGIPYGVIDEYEMFLGFPSESFNASSDTEIIEEIKKVVDEIKGFHKQWVYVLPDIPHALLEEATLENDNRMYNDIFLNKVCPVTSCVYAMLDKKVNSKINLIKQGDASDKFIHWISIQYAKNGSDAIREVDFATLHNKNEQRKKAVPLPPLDSGIPDGQNGGGVAPVNHEFDSPGMSNSQAKIKTLKPPKHHGSSGFSSIWFIVTTLSFSLLIGIGVGYLLIK